MKFLIHKFKTCRWVFLGKIQIYTSIYPQLWEINAVGHIFIKDRRSRLKVKVLKIYFSNLILI